MTAPSKTNLHATATSRTSLAAKAEGTSAKGDGDRDGDAVVGSPGNFSGTLKKLCMWEKKLYSEVKVSGGYHLLYSCVRVLSGVAFELNLALAFWPFSFSLSLFLAFPFCPAYGGFAFRISWEFRQVLIKTLGDECESNLTS